jgi:hypothetical protein
MLISSNCNGFNISNRFFLSKGGLNTTLSARSLAATSAGTRNDHVGQRGSEKNQITLESARAAALQIETALARDGIDSVRVETILFLIQLANATGENRYLKTATSGADYLGATWRELAEKPEKGLLSGKSSSLSLYSGLAGVAYVLNETGKATGKDKYFEAARTATDHIVRAAKAVGSGLAWSDAPGIAGDGSIVLYLLYAAREFDCALYGITAERAGDHILEIANNERFGGFSWSGFPAFPGLPKDAYLPAFEDGTAGIVYVFARLYSETRKARFLFAANQGASHLQRVATLGGEVNPISHPLSDLPDLHYAGFCHGPAGTARAFFEIYKITREPVYQIWAEQIAQKLLQSDAPGNLTQGRWNVVCQCCGSPAVIDLFVEMWAFTKRLDYLATAQRAASHLLNQETNLDDKSARKVEMWVRVDPWEVSTKTDCLVGASGVGSTLLRLHLAVQGEYGSVRFPDSRMANAQ